MGLVGDVYNGLVSGAKRGLSYLNPASYVSHVNPQPIQDAQAKAQANAQQFGDERTNFATRSTPMVNGISIEPMQHTEARSGAGHIAGDGQLVPVTNPALNPINAARQQQNNAIGLVNMAATGAAPSAAEIAGKAAAERAASQQFGQAAALQGGLSPGAALRMASEGSADILSRNANDMAAQRAAEEATARGQLVSATSGLRGNEQDLATNQAQLNIQSQIANQRAALEARGLDDTQIRALLQAQLQSQGLDAALAAQLVDIQAKNASADNSAKGGVFNSLVSLIPKPKL